MKPVFKCEYCNFMGTREVVEEHEKVCIDKPEVKCCQNCKYSYSDESYDCTEPRYYYLYKPYTNHNRSNGSWSAYIDSCFSENNLIFFSKTREFKSGYGFKTTIKNNLNYHTLYSMLKDLKENIEYILYNFKSYTEE